MNLPETVAEIMTEEVVVLHEEDNLNEVALDMERYRFRHLPVVDDRELVGIVSQRDLLKYTVSRLEDGALAEARDRELKEGTFVARIMTRDPLTVRPQTPISVAAAKMIEARVNCLPVVNERNELQGIVTSHDFLRMIADLNGSPARPP